MTTAGTVALRSAGGRWLLAAAVLGSGLAMLDATVVNVALPHIGANLDTGVAGLQWTVTGYTLTLAAFILLGGALGDRYGRRRVFVVGVSWFALASLLCGLAPNVGTLVAARALQGIGGALLTPGSLALISASIDERDRGAAIGAWSGLGGVASAAGPLLGGWLVGAVSWRAVFLINVPVAAAVVLIALRRVPESRDAGAAPELDLTGTVLAVAALALGTYGLIEAAVVPAVAGVVLLVAFVIVQRRSRHPLVPPSLFGDRVFVAANLVTLAVYAALGGTFFLLILQLQVVAGYSPLAAGAATLPITVLMLTLSSYAGAVASRIGPRIPMTIGPLLSAVGLLLLWRIGPGAPYVTAVLPGVVVFGLGLSTLVAPLTTAVLGAAPSTQAGIASGVNNAVARTAQLLAVAALPPLVGIAGADYADPAVFDRGFDLAMGVCAGLLVLGGLTSAVLIRRGPNAPPVPVERSRHCGVGEPASHPR